LPIPTAKFRLINNMNGDNNPQSKVFRFRT
jgi:hypothetical protein